MDSRKWAGTVALIGLLTALGPAAAAAAADDATLLRVFLTDGTSLVSYGEPARVGDRVVFSMPTAATENPPLHLMNLAASRVDWDRTNRYATTARATHYIETQAETDYAALSNDIARALSDIGTLTDPARRLAIVEESRKTLALWPQNHFNYRQAEVRQMTSMLDEAIADLRAAGGAVRFDLNLSTFVDPPTIVEPLMPPLTPRAAIEQVLRAARFVDTAAERTSLLGVALTGLDRDASVLPADWATATRANAKSALDGELKIDRDYQSLAKRMMALADRRARLADVRGLERLVDRIHRSDKTLGGKRAESVDALVAAVQVQLDAARQLKLAREQWALRAPVFRRYRLAITAPLDRFATLRASLEDIKSLAGSTPANILAIQRSVAAILKQASGITPPVELRGAHALLVSAAQLAASAAEIRREATLAADLTRAWDASSAAAGSLMLGARARTDIQSLLRPPQLR